MSGKQATTVSISPALMACCNSFEVSMPGIPIPPFMRPRGAWTREGGLRKRWPAPNLADGALCRQDLGLTLLHHVADRRTLEALVLNWYQMMAVRTRRASVIQRTSAAALPMSDRLAVKKD
jgi:hypothetical protein